MSERPPDVATLSAATAAQLPPGRGPLAQEAYLRALQETLPCAIHLYDAQGRLVQANAAALAAMGRDAVTALGRAPHELSRFLREDGTAMPNDEIPSRIVLRTGGAVRGMIVGVQTGDGASRWYQVAASPIFGPEGAVSQVMAVSFDITERREAERALQHSALHDALTGLPNRVALHAHLEGAIADACENGDSTALLLLDIDRFREVNDTLGHRNGDVLVQQIGVRLRDALEPGATIARLGGDEFGILLQRTSGKAAAAVAGRMLEALTLPFQVDGQRLDVDASIGIASYPEHGGDADTLLRRADVAMYLAKGSKDGLAVYAQELDVHSPARLALVSDLRRAISQDQFFLSFQPQLSLAGRRLRGVEALARWQHPQRGLVRPDQFVPLAEGTGAIKQLTLWVLDAALRQCRSWRRAGIHLPVAVNLSARNLQDGTLPLALADLLDLRQVPADDLILEITESTIMADPDRAMEVLTQLGGMGVRLAIDDFGTGYSSLAYLKRLPANEIKIDKSFVLRMSEDQDDATIVRSIVDLGHNLGLEVVAEGVEDCEAWNLLAALGCDMAQGYFISPPLPAPELERWLDKQAQL